MTTETEQLITEDRTRPSHQNLKKEMKRKDERYSILSIGKRQRN
jgi:hypothetical protein